MPERIRIREAEGTWVVRAGGAVLAETNRALELSEGDYPAVIYFPREDIAMAFLEPSDHTSHCPHKGEASYFSIETKSRTLPDAAWTYADPKPSVIRIRDHVAFYPKDGIVAVERI